METLTREQRIAESRDLRPGDVVTQEFQDVVQGEEVWAVRSIQIDRILSAYVIYRNEGRDYLVPVILLHGWDVQRGQAVKVACAPRRIWTAQRAEGT